MPMRLRLTAVLAGLAAACTPPAQDPPAAAPPPAAPEAVAITREGETLTFSFDAGRTLTAARIGPVTAAEPALTAPPGAAVIGYAVTGEAFFPAAPLCAEGPAAGIIIVYRAQAPDLLGVFTGGTPGAPEAQLCAVHPVEVTGPDKP